MGVRKPPEAFWDRATPAPCPRPGLGDCLTWTGSIRKGGAYGQVWWHGRMHGAHRIAWTLAKGPIPAALWVLHSCDNPPCVNPDHLWLGTASDNALDRSKKGRNGRGFTRPGLVGSAHPHAKMTEAKVVDLRARRSAGENRLAVADAFGIAPVTVDAIYSGRLWKHVPMPTEAAS